MINLYDSQFENLLANLEKKRAQGKTLDELKYAGKDNEEGLKKFLDSWNDAWDEEIDLNTWYEFFDTYRKGLEDRLSFKEIRGAGIVAEKDSVAPVKAYEGPNGMWKYFENKLKKKGFNWETISSIKESAERTLTHISSKTIESGPKKGMVVGNVQSGKTSNMEALMAMASDYGFNMFVILSGTIENLREQTEKRLYDDLKTDTSKNTSISWVRLTKLSKKSDLESKLSELSLRQEDHFAYFTVCLKNSTRLKNLVDWFETDYNKWPQIKMLIIDDEADQASINTSKMKDKEQKEIEKERTKINKLILKLVSFGDAESKGIDSNLRIGGMNYISYTATPYANFLNESSEKSLYPGDFINFLDPAREYYGPEEIFGVENDEHYDGLNIIREVTDYDKNEIFSSGIAPQSLKNAFHYFLCASACMRYWQRKVNEKGKTFVKKQPVTMLVHADVGVNVHNVLAKLIESLIFNAQQDLDNALKTCKNIWDIETSEFSRHDLYMSMKEHYENEEVLHDYPSFEEILPYLNEILKTKHTNILLDESQDRIYHRGIHVCIDNSKSNPKASDEYHLRLAYPETIEDDEEAPVFVVIGGNTLSRGLTIEGLVTTYFVRKTSQADTLMQMGRWFGYRKGYEILPRLWLNESVIDKFMFLSTLDNDMRQDLKKYFDVGISPREYGPRLLNSPKVSWLSITSRNKMQAAQTAEMDFSGYSPQTTVFEDNIDFLQHNIQCTERLIEQMGTPVPSFDKSSLVWRNVSFEDVLKPYFQDYKVAKTNQGFHEMDLFIQWIEKMDEQRESKKWNVVVAGTGDLEMNNTPGKYWEISGYKVGNNNRARVVYKFGKPSDLLDIRVLRSPKHLIADIDASILTDKQRKLLEDLGTNNKYKEMRHILGYDETPLLMIYRINQEYKYKNTRGVKNGTYKRVDMKAKEDMIGICVVVPGDRRSLAGKITVKLTKKDMEEFELNED